VNSLGPRLGRRAACLGGLAAIAAQPARADKAADTLRISWRDAIPDLDPYRNQIRTGFVVAHHVWDCLIDREPRTLELQPLLATDWRREDETTLAFRLREGVRFHDGSPFSADDVVYTVNAARAADWVAAPGLLAWLAGAEAVDPTHVRLRLHQPFPAALEYLAMALPILPRGYRERVGPTGFSRAPIGTGPYRIVPGEDASRLRMEKFEEYFPGGPKSRAMIGTIAISTVADADAEFADLLADRADWIWQVGPDMFDAASHQPGLATQRAESMRIGYLSMDAAGRSGADNPLTQLKVRQAICHAIDRAALLRRLAGVATRIAEAPCFPTQVGCDSAAAERYPYDPARARALLAEAGFPQGFETDLVSYVLAEDGVAIRGALQAVGITARLAQVPTSEGRARAAGGQAPLFLGSWGSFSINDVAAILPQFFTGGPQDYARSPALSELIQRAGVTGDADQRRALYTDAIRMITGQAYWLPLHTYATTYCMARGLNFRAFPDELPRFYLANWK
jgi:peptide/nickel transport system substrate-binding protein